jgi:thymidylate synthase
MRPDAASICWWNPNGKFISDDGLTFRGANYGLRMLAQLNDVIDLLGEDPASRRTWVPIWGTRDDDFSLEYRRNGKDVPCMLGFGLSIVPGGRVDMEVVMRSQSAYGVFPYDLYLMSVVHELVANQLGVGLGFLHWHCMSLHVYANEIEKASRVIEETVKSESDTPIQINLETAMQMYPVVFQELTPCIATGNTIRWDASDPVVNQMLQGAALINTQASA